MATILKETLSYIARDPTDQQLVRQIAEGDTGALELLFQQYSKPIYGYLVQMVFDEHVAEDLIQEVFIAAWSGARRFRGLASVKTWLFQIAHNLAVTWIRRNKVRVRYEEIKADYSTSNPEEEYVGIWMYDQVRDAIRKLSKEHREVIELVFYHEMSYSEVAAVMKCPIGTVKSRMSYARRHLDRYLKAIVEQSNRGKSGDLSKDEE
jgi:RNA polymerase sigma-70 factor (ECF subfamily)